MKRAEHFAGKESLSTGEIMLIVGICVLVAIISVILWMRPFADGRTSVDEKNVDNAVELARQDIISNGGANGRYDAGNDRFTYYYANNSSEIGIELSDTPSFRGVGDYADSTIVVVIAGDGTVVSAGWVDPPKQ